MKEATRTGAVLDVLVTHLPALWVAGTAALGVATLSTLDQRPVPTEPNADAHPVVVETARPFPLAIGIVERVIDGDTFDVKLERTGEQVRVRLAWVDAPEREQPFGAEAARWAQESLRGRRVVLTVQGVDAYGRLVAQLSVEGDGYMWDVGATLARIGLAWLDPRHGEDRESLREDQELARQEGVGLWSEPDAVAPWDWRRIGQAVESNGGARAL
jgi:micrococcal nuclease